MNCPICKTNNVEESCEELVCYKCGATFELELLGFYPDGSNDRIEAGPEFDEWKRKWKR